MKTEIRIPYHCSSPKVMVFKAQDIEINLHDTFLTIRINCSEDVPDMDDEYMPMKRKNYIGTSTILKCAVIAIETAYDDVAESFDFRIMTTTTQWGYNVESRELVMDIYNRLENWLLS